METFNLAQILTTGKINSISKSHWATNPIPYLSPAGGIKDEKDAPNPRGRVWVAKVRVCAGGHPCP
jgi:hypothetical protein